MSGVFVVLGKRPREIARAEIDVTRSELKKRRVPTAPAFNGPQPTGIPKLTTAMLRRADGMSASPSPLTCLALCDCASYSGLQMS